MDVAPEVKPDDRDFVHCEDFRLECFEVLTTDEMAAAYTVRSRPSRVCFVLIP